MLHLHIKAYLSHETCIALHELLIPIVVVKILIKIMKLSDSATFGARCELDWWQDCDFVRFTILPFIFLMKKLSGQL